VYLRVETNESNGNTKKNLTFLLFFFRHVYWQIDIFLLLGLVAINVAVVITMGVILRDRFIRVGPSINRFIVIIVSITFVIDIIIACICYQRHIHITQVLTGPGVK